TFNDPTSVSNVWVRMGQGSVMKEAQAVRGVDGIFRAEIPSNMNRPVYVDYQVGDEYLVSLPMDGTLSEWQERLLLPPESFSMIELTRQSLLSEAEEMDAVWETLVTRDEDFDVTRYTQELDYFEPESLGRHSTI